MADVPKKGPTFGKLKSLGQRRPATAAAVESVALPQAPVIVPPPIVEPIASAAPAIAPADTLTVPPVETISQAPTTLRVKRRKEAAPVIPPVFTQYTKDEIEEEAKDRYTLNADAPPSSGLALPDAFIPPTRKGFVGFIRRTFQAFELPASFGEIDPDACKKRSAAPGGGKAVEPMLYQKFVREYLRSAAPYRGLLVYHGLGSGKTCSSIAAAEALFGAGDKKRIIVMTPGSLRGNFQKELSFCGFRHYNTDNNWIKVPLGADPMTEMFAETILHIPNTPPKSGGAGFLDKVKKRVDPELRAIWIPDFTPDTESPHYKDLPAAEQSAIRQQITAVLEERITFINYNGIPYSDLKEIICNQRELFDDAVIIIDEVHNLTRGMQGKIGLFLEPKVFSARAAKKAIELGRDLINDDRYEPITPDRKALKYCSLDLEGKKKYNRSILIYRLIAEARNSKIVALSGTPLINQADELGIMMNMVAGYIDAAEFTIMGTDPSQLAEFQAICKRHPRVDSVFVNKSDTKRDAASLGRTNITLTVFQHGYSKVLNPDGTFRGIKEDPSPDGSKSVREVFEEVRADAEAMGLQFDVEAVAAVPGAKKNIKLEFKSFPRFPVRPKDFNAAFIDSVDASTKNDDILRNRMMGFVSYFRGATEGLMPDVGVDEYVYVPLEGYSAQYYAEKRRAELDMMGSDVKKEGEEEESATNPAAYRFNTRAACNFAFPKGIPRPLRSLKEKSTEEMADKEEAVVLEEGETASVLDPEIGAVDPVADVFEYDETEAVGDEGAEGPVPAAQEGGADSDKEVAEEEEPAVAEEEEPAVADMLEESIDEALAAAQVEEVDAPVPPEPTEIEGFPIPGPDVIPPREMSPKEFLALKKAAAPPTSPEDPDNPPKVKMSKQIYAIPKPKPKPKTVVPKTPVVPAPAAEPKKIAAPATVVASAATSTGATIIGETADYLRRLRDALGRIDRGKDKYLKIDGPPQSNLAYFSPKYAAMLSKIQESPGSALVYSQFKTSEGLGIFGYALQANGYAEIRVEGSDENPYFPEDVKESLLRGTAQKRYIFFTGEGSKVIRRIILNIFNANFDQLPLQIKEVLTDPRTGFTETKNHHGEICNIIGITGAGAEGISLKSVRSVHVMEPYWNKVRTEQVKGRAIRLCSHEDLPVEERKVDIYTYIAHFTPEDIAARKIDETIITMDGGETTDVHILKIGNRKEKILQSFLTAMKEAAVDCFQNAIQNNEKIVIENPDGTRSERDLACFPGIAGSPEEAAFHPDFNVHLTEKGGEKRRTVDISTLVPESVARRTKLLPSAMKVLGTAAPVLAEPTAPTQPTEAPKTALPEIRSTKQEVKEKRTIIKFPPGSDTQYILKEDHTIPGEVAWYLYKYPGGETLQPKYRAVDNPITGKKVFTKLK
jgi:hypothetical protein